MTMKKSVALLLALLMVVCSSVSSVSAAAGAKDTPDSYADYLHDQFDDPENEYRPGVRWWMAEGTHTDETLQEEMKAIAESGFGAVEFLAMNVYGSNSSTYGWGSDEWTNDTKLLIKTATEYGLGFSVTSGTNWGNANLPDTYEYNGELINPDHPSTGKQLSYQSAVVDAGNAYSGLLSMTDRSASGINDQELQTVVAVGMIDGTTLDYNDTHTLVAGTDYTETATGVQVSWTAPTVNTQYTIFAFWMHGTGSTANPSVSKNYALNYVDADGMEALIDYWQNVVLTPDMLETIRENGRGELYMDSLEVSGIRGTGGLLWGRTYLDEFYARRGYRLEPYIPFLLNSTSGGTMGAVNFTYNNFTDDGWAPSKDIAKLRNDYFQTNTELYMENVLEPLQKWLHDYCGMTLRAEISYGGHFYEISQPGKYVDGIETESFEFGSQIDSYRNLSGVAHLYNKTYSNEMGASMRAMMQGMYSAPIDQYNQIMYTGFAAGITRNVLHTWSSQWGPSEKLAAWPGYVGSNFPERFGTRQPSSEHYNEWTTMLARYQKALRQGVSRMDVGILRSDYMLNNTITGVGYENTSGFRAGEGLYYDISLQNAGYTYDYFSPVLLQNKDEDGNPDIVFEDGVVQPNGPGYQALIVYQEEMPLESAEILLEWARGGLPVVIVNNHTEMGRSGGFGSSKLLKHGQAASRTPLTDDKDSDLSYVMRKLKALDNVVELDDAADTVEALRTLGVDPRADFAESNNTILTYMREDAANDTTYLYAYNYQPGTDAMKTWTELGDPYTVELSIDGVGKPYMIDAWTGEVTPVGTYQIANGKTMMDLTLDPGATALIALHRDDNAADSLHAVQSDAYQTFTANGEVFIQATESGSYATTLSNGSMAIADVEVPEDIPLNNWDLTVTTWTKGNLVTRDGAADKAKYGYDHDTVEYKFETVKTDIDLGTLDELKPWKELGVDESGIGMYTTSFTLPETWNDNYGLILELGSIYRNTAVVYINGTRLPVSWESLNLDITDYVLPGKTNTLQVEVTSNLDNSVKGTAAQNYGLVGKTILNTYVVSSANTDSALSAEAPASAQVNSDFDVTVVTAGSVTDVKLYNEYDMAISRKAMDVIDNGDGTKTWIITISVGTVGSSRTFKVVTKGLGDYYRDSGKTVSLDITSIPPVLSSFDLPDETVANRTFIVKATTDMAATKIVVYNEYGTKMGVKSLSYKVVDGQKEWTGIMSIGTKGERTFTAYAVNKYGVKSTAMTDSISVKAFA
ncbi:MAG: hypothetical protein HFE85_05465 [Clostridiales bacterium]|nr:hypothetical protein [Clostridiales bacterium]